MGVRSGRCGQLTACCSTDQGCSGVHLAAFTHLIAGAERTAEGGLADARVAAGVIRAHVADDIVVDITNPIDRDRVGAGADEVARPRQAQAGAGGGRACDLWEVGRWVSSAYRRRPQVVLTPRVVHRYSSRQGPLFCMPSFKLAMHEALPCRGADLGAEAAEGGRDGGRVLAPGAPPLDVPHPRGEGVGVARPVDCQGVEGAAALWCVKHQDLGSDTSSTSMLEGTLIREEQVYRQPSRSPGCRTARLYALVITISCINLTMYLERQLLLPAEPLLLASLCYDVRECGNGEVLRRTVTV